jgi:hypothetical protein
MSVINPSNTTKNDMIVALVQKELQFSALLAGLVTNVSQFAVKGNKSVEFPKLTSFSVANRSFGSAGTDSVISETVDTLNLNQNAYLSYIIDTASAIQSSISWEIETAKRAASAHGRNIDSVILATLESVGTPCGTAGDITKAIVLAMRLALKKANADMNQVVLVVSAAQEAKMLNIDEFTRNDIYGANQVIMSGQVGRVYGAPVIVHNGLTDGQFFMFEKSGVAFALQSAPSIAEQPAIEYGTSSVKRAMDCLFGTCGLQLSGGLSPLVIKHGA